MNLPLFPESKHNPDEAPAGYYATPKAGFDWRQGNLCRHCDWRPTCQKPDTDFLAYGHRCMSNAIVTADGKTHQRNDECSVVFKRKVVV